MDDEDPRGIFKSYNPPVSDDLEDEDLAKVKGDAIGDTLYSERFVLSTLLKLTRLTTDLSEDEEYEKDLCTLWDMTIEKDVVKLLLEHNVLELFSGAIEATEDKRLTEILVGIIGNMCDVSETRDELCMRAEITSPILELISCSDTLILIQLMRFLLTALVFENSGDEIMWFQHFKDCDHFVEYFSFMLMNSMSSTLLLSAFDALNAICAKFAVIEIQPDVNDLCFRDVFVQPCLVMGVIEAFKTLMPENIEKDGSDATSLPSENWQRIMSVFLDVHLILSQYYSASIKCYEPILPEFLKCMSQVLSPLCHTICLLPLTSTEQGIVENTNEIFQALHDPFDEVCFAQMITIWSLINNDRMEIEANNEWDEDEAEDAVNSNDLLMTILEFLERTVVNATDEQVKNSLGLHSSQTILKILRTLEIEGSGSSTRGYIKLRTVFDSLQNELSPT